MLPLHVRKVKVQTKVQGIMDVMREQNVNYFAKEELKLMLLHKAFSDFQWI